MSSYALDKNLVDALRKLMAFNGKEIVDDTIGAITDRKTDEIDKNDVSNYFSCGVQKIGIKNVLWCFKRVIKKTPNVDIISLGSGNGVIEKIIDDNFGCNIICVEPHFNEFIPAPDKFTKKPAFKTIDEYLDTKSDKKIILFINWAYISVFNPELATCEIHNYDYGAIIKLNPDHIISIYDPTGSAGSMLFTTWANKKCGVPSLPDSWFHIDIGKKYMRVPGYHYVGQIIHKAKDYMDTEIYARLIWLSRDPFNSVYDFPIVH